MALKAQCTACGGPIVFENKVSLFAVCSHCGCSVLRHDMNLESLGKMAELVDDGTPLQLGTRGKHRGVPFQIVGRIQIAYPDGYWNEWFLDFAGERDGWLGEAQGMYAVNFPIKVRPAIPPFGALKIGMPVMLDDRGFFVRDIQQGQCVSGEGELPFQVECGSRTPTADLAAEDGAFATLDYSEGITSVYVGEYQDFPALAFENLRRVEGW